jgi:hypothetical protein
VIDCPRGGVRSSLRPYPKLGYADSGLHTAEVPKSAFGRKYRQFRELLTEARLRAGLTQTALARKLGRHQSFVSKFENGERRLDVIEFLDVARALSLDPVRVIAELGRK